jgi:hypothetical protein
MLRRIRYTQIGIVAGGLLALALTNVGSSLGTNPVWLFIWMALANLAYMRLKCVLCGERLALTPNYFSRGFRIHTCAHCGEKQPP